MPSIMRLTRGTASRTGSMRTCRWETTLSVSVSSRSKSCSAVRPAKRWRKPSRSAGGVVAGADAEAHRLLEVADEAAVLLIVAAGHRHVAAGLRAPVGDLDALR